MKYLINDIKNIKITGRNSIKDIGSLFWIGSKIEFNTNSTYLNIDYYSSEDNGVYLNIYVDNYLTIRVLTKKGFNTINVFSGLNEGNIYNVKIIRDTEVSSCLLSIKSFDMDGEFLNIEDKDYIEFVGDSISNGVGLHGATKDYGWSPFVYTLNNNYAIKVSNELNLDYSFIAMSGWGILSGWDNNPNNVIPSNYKYVSSINNSKEKEDAGSLDLYIPDKKAKYVVINLGTNDCGAFFNPPYVDELNNCYKFDVDDNNLPTEETIEKYKNALVDFYKLIHSIHTNSKILVCNNAVNDYLKKSVTESINDYQNNYNKNIKMVELIASDSKTVGANNHPNYMAHERYYKSIIEALKEF